MGIFIYIYHDIIMHLVRYFVVGRSDLKPKLMQSCEQQVVQYWTFTEHKSLDHKIQ